jgi:hypothetical protein
VLKKSRMCSWGCPLSPSAAAATGSRVPSSTAPPPGSPGAPQAPAVSPSAVCPTGPPPVAVAPADPPRKVPPAAACRPVPRDRATAPEDLAAEAEAVAERRSSREGLGLGGGVWSGSITIC